MVDKLTDKQAKFVEEYCVDLNATQAAIRAGYSENSAQEIGSQNLSKLIIKEAVRAKQEEHAEHCLVSIGTLTHELNTALAMAVDQVDPSALRAIIMSKAKLHGLEVNKEEISGKDGKDLNFTVNVLAKPSGN